MKNVATFKCLFVFVTFVSRFFATKHLLILIMHAQIICTYIKVPVMQQIVEKLTLKNDYIYVSYL